MNELSTYVKSHTAKSEHKYDNVILHLVDIGDYLTFRNFLPYYRKYYGENTLFAGNIAYQSIYDAFDNNFEHTLWLDKKTLNTTEGKKQWLNTLIQIDAKRVILPAYSANGFPDLMSLLAFSQTEKYLSDHGTDSFQKQFYQVYLSLSKHNHIIPLKTQQVMHEFERNREIAETLTGERIELVKPNLPVSKNKKQEIVLFCGANHASKVWPATYYIQLILKLENRFPHQHTFVLSGSQKEQPVAAEIMSGLTDFSGRIKNTCGETSLVQLIQQIADAALLISPDTSAQHIAASVNTPCIVYSNGVNYHRFVKPPDAFTQMHPMVAPRYIQSGYPLWRFAPSSLIKSVKPETVASEAFKLLSTSI